MPDLPAVDDDGPYDELAVTVDEKVSYGVITTGGTLTVTRRALLADDIGGIKRAVEMVDRAADRTLAQRGWNKLIANDTYDADGLALFHANHFNLGSAALSVTSLTAAREALFAQKEPGSDERLGLSGPFLLAIPIDLEAAALPINNCDRIPGSATDGNPWFHKFGPEGERIFTNPLFPDANDWCLLDIGGKVGIIEVGFLMGRQTPEIFQANDPKAGSALNQDRLVFKVRHEYNCEILDYKGAYKSVVT